MASMANANAFAQAIIGYSSAHRERSVVALYGDGSFMMLMGDFILR
nr:thiamine pyrophosphate-dependent enzyme [Coxiella-like endosymbiont]